MISQKDVDRTFLYTQGCGNWCEDEDCSRIKKIIKVKLGLDVSISEAYKFWSWRSEQYEASWLSIHSDEEIVEWFVKFVTPDEE
jgi:hypothetical protein